MPWRSLKKVLANWDNQSLEALNQLALWFAVSTFQNVIELKVMVLSYHLEYLNLWIQDDLLNTQSRPIL